MLPITITIPDSFLKEEERMGYTVTENMKKVWAVQLDLLEQLKRVCEKYGLTYYADSGTLMGAIRHQGYIPWDDDIDIVMKRSDFDKLISVGKEAFTEPYFLQSAHSEKFPRGYARLRNSNTTAMTHYDLGKDVNHGIFIDIFPLDHVPDDPAEMKKWVKKIRRAVKTLNYGVYKPMDKMTTLRGRLNCLGANLAVSFIGYDRLIQKYERICKKYNDQNTRIISYTSYSFGKPKHLWPAADFEKCHEVPFEFTTINIPDGYDDRLTIEYKDYMTPRQAPTTHGGMVLDPETPYKVYLEQHTEQELKKILQDE